MLRISKRMAKQETLDIICERDLKNKQLKSCSDEHVDLNKRTKKKNYFRNCLFLGSYKTLITIRYVIINFSNLEYGETNFDEKTKYWTFHKS